MKNVARCAVVLTVVTTLGFTLALPALAGRRINYRGSTSQDERMRLEILKKDDGRRFLRGGILYFTTNCEDPSAEVFGISLGRARLDDSGGFLLERRNTGIFSFSYTFDGVVRWGGAAGTFEFNYPTLTEDDQAQLCTTGVLDWTADRLGSRPARPLPAPDDVTMLKIDRDGELRVVRP
jgi:hypothetical protein